MKYYEVQFDGLVGPTHNFGGLSYGNLASLGHKNISSNPSQAALQGLRKMKFVMDKGLVQAVLPPAKRPNIDMLRKLGYKGDVNSILSEVYRKDQVALSRVSSASNMWAANAATISPSLDTGDKRLHVSPANLISNFHRSYESEFVIKSFRMILNDSDLFQVHPALPNALDYSDEGAANHIRICPQFDSKGLEIFVYGKESGATPFKKFPARQTKLASEAIAKRHELDLNNTLFVKQNEKAINKGVFHNDVISVGNRNLLFYHEMAFEDKNAVEKIAEKYFDLFNEKLLLLQVKNTELSLKSVVDSYLFNSQIISLPDGSMLLIAPEECRQNKKVKLFLDSLVKNDECPINLVEFLNLKESMWNGGGPACLRLRVLMNESELNHVNQGVILTNELYEQLCDWVTKNYRTELYLKDLATLDFYKEIQDALLELECILGLKELY